MHLTTEPQNTGSRTDRIAGKIDNSTIITGDFNTLPSVIDITMISIS